jgi:EAL domain-containing protein (putative c-di-GMP-specific phosphodiesterase class I)
MPDTDVDGGRQFAERLLRRLLVDRVSGEYRRPISFSAGVAAAPRHTRDKLELQSRADAALYRSKRGGRTLVTTFDPDVDRPVLDDAARAKLSSRVTAIARSRALTAVYQPMVHLQTGRPIAFEGLVRPARESGFDSPTALFSAAEATGRIVELDRACLEVVATGARGLPSETYVSLNISPRTFEAPEFNASGFLTLLERAQVDPRQVILELTERQPIEDLDRLQKALDACRAAGIQIAADDIGAGNAGLRMLSQIQFDVMKIDLSLVQVAAGREPVTSVLTSLIDLGRRWGALVVAEGVETPEQLRMIRGLGVDAAQGYLIARPGPLDAAAHFDLSALVVADRPSLLQALSRDRSVDVVGDRSSVGPTERHEARSRERPATRPGTGGTALTR